VDVLEEKKGENITLLDLHGIAIFADYFVIGSGTSDRMIHALADAVQDQVRKKYGMKGRVEGASENGWVLIDLGDVVVHLFSPDRRDYYHLEDLWAQGKVLIHLQ
jgi:ribosome-associated protein